jgi:biotin operon repressor
MKTYRGPRQGIVRDLTPQEVKRLVRVGDSFVSTPPWTPKALKANQRFREVLMELYEDGVSREALANALGWDSNRIGQQISAARKEGTGTGRRRYIPPPPRTVDRVHRNLTKAEEHALSKQFDLLPRSPAGFANWKTSRGSDLLDRIDDLRADGVPLEEIARVLGMTRQAVSLHLRGRTKGSTPAQTRSLTKSEATELTRHYKSLPVSTGGARQWSTPEGVALVDLIERLTRDGVPMTSVRALRGGTRTDQIVVRGIDDALGIRSSVIGRMVGIRDTLAERAGV